MHAFFPSGTVLRAPEVACRLNSTTHHGIRIDDPYAWLRAADWQAVLRDPAALPSDIAAHLRQENAHVHAALAHTESLQQILSREMRARLPARSPIDWVPAGPYEYGRDQMRDAAQPRLVRRRRGERELQVLVDLEVEAAGHGYFRAGYSIHSSDHRWLAWFVDEVGAERFAIRFRDLESGKDLATRIYGAAIGGCFSQDGQFFLYVALDASNRKHRVCLHRLGSTAASDRVLLQEEDPRFALNLRLTQSSRWIVLSAQSQEETEVRLLSAADPLAHPVTVALRRSGIRLHVDEGGGVLYGLTNADGADDFKIATARIGKDQVAAWSDLVAHQPGTTRFGHRVFRRHLVWLERHEGTVRVRARRHSDGATRILQFDDGPCAFDLGAGLDFDTDTVRLVYSSMRTPVTVFEAQMETGSMTPLMTEQVAGEFDSNDYLTRRIQVRSADGAKVPVSLVHHRSTLLNGSAPCLLYGYGAYGVTMPAHFDPLRLSLLDRGFVYAIAHVRGGGEAGAAWHKAGKLAHKHNGVDDLLAAARGLVDSRICAPDHIVGHGVSAGGALLGAALNQSPQTFAAVMLEAPFVDVLNTLLDPGLPLTALEWQEWGNPIRSRAAFDWIARWSPYENVRSQAYPPVLAIQALADPRVTYWEPAKWVARLRACQTADAPIMLATRLHAGHSGASSRLDGIAQAALLQAFALTAVGLGPPTR